MGLTWRRRGTFAAVLHSLTKVFASIVVSAGFAFLRSLSFTLSLGVKRDQYLKRKSATREGRMGRRSELSVVIKRLLDWPSPLCCLPH